MFERFTDRARRIVVISQEEARRLGHGQIGTEHLLLAILREGENKAAILLGSSGIEYGMVFEAIEGKNYSNVPHSRLGHLPFDPYAKKVLEISLRESQQLGHNYIGAEHMFLALLKGNEYTSTEVLIELGADPRKFYEEMHAIASRPQDALVQVKAVPVTVYQVTDDESPYPFKYMDDAYELMKRAEHIANGSPITREHIEQALSGF